jgi:intraflagellar transport protein 46
MPAPNGGVRGEPPRGATAAAAMAAAAGAAPAAAALPPVLRDALAHAAAFQPPAVELDVRPFPQLPPYAPAIGLPLLCDPWLRPPRPDGAPDSADRLDTLDEPCAQQSDPVLLNLQLRALAYHAGDRGRGARAVRTVADAAGRPGDVARWAASVRALNAGRAAPRVVVHPRPMPTTEALMQAWPPAVEAAVGALLAARRQPPLLPADLPLAEQARLACAMLDVPVHGSDLVRPLHAVFTAYAAFAARERQL